MREPNPVTNRNQGEPINSTFKSEQFPFLELTFNETIYGCPKSHMHESLVIVAVEQGNILMHRKGSDFLLEEKSLGIINPYEMHCASKVDETSQGVYALYLDKEYIKQLQKELFEVENYVPFSEHLIDNTKTYDEFMDVCHNLFSDSCALEKEEKLIEFVSNLLMKYTSKRTLKTPPILFLDIKNHIDTNLCSHISLQSIANEFLITSFHLIRMFKKELKISPYQYILNKRVNFAKTLLSENMDIAQVAVESGFIDQSHLYKYFKQTFSISPKAYQESLHKQK